MKNLYSWLFKIVCSVFFSLLILTALGLSGAWGQSPPPDRDQFKGQHQLKKKETKLPKENLKDKRLENAKHNFKASLLKGVKGGRLDPAASLSNPTSLQFGPDGRLYVSQQNGLIKVFTISKNAPNDYSTNSEEVISLINLIPNHNDDGSLASGVTTRQVTGLVVTGTATAPILYVGSSDSRIGGPSGDLNLDTNSGIISKLTKTPTGWDKVDLVRGLPRSEENHGNHGMQLDGTKLYVVTGGNTNAGGPSTNFAFTPEYALTTAVLSIDLTVIEALPTQGSGNTKYKYDLPTLDDPTRSGNPDAGDPFGGNDGLNQAKIVSGGPVQVFATGFRNAYDLVITRTAGKPRRMYVTDNGPNQGWGGHPANEGVGTATNNYIAGEPGSTGPGPNDPVVNNLDNFHYIGNLDTYVAGSYYGGHPNPTRANPAGAGLYTHANGSGVWRTSKTGANPLPADWPPVSTANPIEGDFQGGGEKNKALLTFSHSTNGIVEYTASGFGGSLKGHLLAASFDGTIQKITLNDAGTDVTNTKGAKQLNTDVPMASNFGAEPLDLTAQGDDDVFPGTIWAACYGSNTIYVFEPDFQTSCQGTYSTTLDDDGDGFDNADEIDAGSNPCSSASRPRDADGDMISNFNDPDDDNDGLADVDDYFPLDAANGTTTNLPIEYNLFNNHPGTGLFGLGFTGLMLPKGAGFEYEDLYKEDNLIAGGAVGAFSVVNVSPGDPYQAINTQENGFQFGVNGNSSTGPFTVKSRLLGPFFNNQIPQYYQSQGVYIGTGDQDNYLKIVLGSDGGQGGIEVLHENKGIVVNNQFFTLPGGLPANTIDLFLSVNPATGSVQPKYAKDGGPIANLGPAILLRDELLTAVQGAPALAVGIISTSMNSTPFTASWDDITIKADSPTPNPAQSVVSFSLMNADTEQEIKLLTAGEQLNLAALPTRNLNIRTNTNPATVGSVVAVLSGAQSQRLTDDAAPYALFGDNAGNYNAWTPGVGSYSLVATPYTSAGGGGTAGTPLSLSFTVVDQSQVPTTGTWQTITPNAGSPTARHEAAYVQAGDKFYLMGGRGIKPVQVYDPIARTWVNAATTPLEIHHFQAVTLEGLVYVVGALTGDYPAEPPIAQVYIYDPKADKWLLGPDIPLNRRRGAAGVVVNNNKIYLMGGIVNGHNGGYVDWFDEFDPATNSWTVLPNAPRTRDHFHAVVIGDKLYAAGGRRTSANTGETFTLTVAEVDVYNFTTGQWSTLPGPIPTQRGASTAVVLDGKLVVIGGESSQPAAHKESEALDVTTNAWQRLTDLQQGRHGAQAIVNNGGIYIVAGSGSQGGSLELSSQEVFFRGSPTTPTGTALTQSQLSAPSSATLGSVAVNTTKSTVVRFTNTTGNQAIVVSSISLSGSNEFTYRSPFALPFVLGVGKSVELNVDLKPLSAGSKVATLAVSHSGSGGSTSVPLSGEGSSPKQQAVISFSLMNADTEQEIKLLTAGEQLNLATLPTRNLNIRTNTNPATVGSVVAVLSGAQSQNQTDDTAPYALFGDNAGSYNAWTPAVGSYSLRATPYTSAGGGGTAGTPFSLSFTVVDQGPVPQQAVISFSLMNADTEQEIRILNNNDVINLASLPTSKINVRANTSPTTVGSVVFVLSGAQSQGLTDNVAPYALFGDSNGNYKPWNPKAGKYSLRATPYSAASGSGTAGTALTIAFTVTNNAGGRVADVNKDLTKRDLGWRFHPNPSIDALNIEFEADHPLPLTIDVVDILGRSVMQLRKQDLNAVRLNLQDLPPGIYFIRVQSRVGTVTRKLLKQ